MLSIRLFDTLGTAGREDPQFHIAWTASLYLPLNIHSYIAVTVSMCIEQSNINKLTFDFMTFQAFSALEGDYFSGCSDIPAPELIDMTEEEYEEACWELPYWGSDFGPYGFVHAIGVSCVCS